MKEKYKLSLLIAISFISLTSCAKSESIVQDEEKKDGTTIEKKLVTYKIGVISDMNRSYGSTSYTPALTAAIDYLKDNNVAAVLSTGDMVAGQKSGLDYEAMWNSFHAHVSIPLRERGIPILPSPGNHDASAWSAFREERNYYRETWNNFLPIDLNKKKTQDQQVQYLPGVVQNFPLNYAVTLGPALFISIDATLPSELINNQIEWLREVLIQGRSYPVKIVFGHIPLFPFSFDRAHEYLANGTVRSGFYRELEDLLEDNDVSYFLSGHHHVYYPGRRSGRVRYVSVPLLGNGARYLLTADRSERNRAPQAFLMIEFNDRGDVELKAYKSPSLELISSSTLPNAISIPRSSASDCSGCGSFPEEFFLDTTARSVYEKL